ncbi:MAG: response regulator [Marinoscillum sp.]
MKKLDCILLVDDDEDCNFFHSRLIKKMNCAERVEISYDGQSALELLKSQRDYSIDLILLDINMPVMDGWNFLDEYKQFDNLGKSHVVVMVSSSLNPDDRDKASSLGVVSDFATKYLNEQSMLKILNTHFKSVE